MWELRASVDALSVPAADEPARPTASSFQQLAALLVVAAAELLTAMDERPCLMASDESPARLTLAVAAAEARACAADVCRAAAHLLTATTYQTIDARPGLSAALGPVADPAALQRALADLRDRAVVELDAAVTAGRGADATYGATPVGDIHLRLRDVLTVAAETKAALGSMASEVATLDTPPE